MFVWLLRLSADKGINVGVLLLYLFHHPQAITYCFSLLLPFAPSRFSSDFGLVFAADKGRTHPLLPLLNMTRGSRYRETSRLKSHAACGLHPSQEHFGITLRLLGEF